jgi:aerobic carbon-monoxide dehydrogenase medium subunit
VIPPEFDYVHARGIDEALEALSAGGDDAKVLAGGQSLVPLLRLRLAYPSVLVDVGDVAEMRGVRDDGDAVVVGASTTHAEVIADPLLRRHVPLVAEATTTVADRQVRHRGTFGGSLAHADPAGDLPAVASEFFVDYLQTALAPDEVLVEVRLPKLGEGWGVHYEKFHRVAQAWAIVGVATAVRRVDGRIEQARIGLTNMGPTPVRATAAERALAGADASEAAIAAATEHAADEASPPTDLGGSADYRRHLAQVLTRRAVVAAAGA